MDAKDTVLLGIAVVAAMGVHVFVWRFFVACALCVAIEVLACLIYLARSGLRPAGAPALQALLGPIMVSVPAALAFVNAVAVGFPFTSIGERIELNMETIRANKRPGVDAG